MIEIGQQVIYGIHGVCSVIGVQQQRSGGKQVEYLILEPMNQTGSRFLIPTHNAAAISKVQKILSWDELDRILHSEEVQRNCWTEDEGKRKLVYRELISSGDRVQLMAMVHTLYMHKSKQSAAGRKVHLCDENFLRDAEKLLCSEIAFVMDMDANAAKQYLRSCLQK